MVIGSVIGAYNDRLLGRSATGSELWCGPVGHILLRLVKRLCVW